MIRSCRAALLALLLVAIAAPASLGISSPTSVPLVDGVRVATATRTKPLPPCRYLDVPTRFKEYRQWRKTLLDTRLRVSRRYVPRDLVSVRRAGIAGSGLIRKVAIRDLRAMAAAARRAGKGIAVRSAYRSYATQVAVFNGWVRQAGYQQALRYSARPGHSEHQLGTSIDFRSAANASAPWSYSDWGQTPSGRWMRKNAWKYGWVMSYPEGRIRQVCYGYEPWHWRYVGRARAKEIRQSGLTLRKFLWRRFESR